MLGTKAVQNPLVAIEVFDLSTIYEARMWHVWLKTEHMQLPEYEEWVDIDFLPDIEYENSTPKIWQNPGFSADQISIVNKVKNKFSIRSVADRFVSEYHYKTKAEY